MKPNDVHKPAQAETDPDNVYDMFVAPGVTRQEIADMATTDIEQHVAQLRADNPDTLPLENWEVVALIQQVAKEIKK